MNTAIKTRIDQINSGIAPEGYEKTDLGTFPCDWENDTFDNLFNFYGGLGKSREELGEKGVCYLHYGDMHTGNFNIVSYAQYLQKPKYDTRIKGNETYLMQDGDIAFLDASEDIEGTSRAVLIENSENKSFIAGLHTILAKEKLAKLSKYYKQYISLTQSVKKQFQRLVSGFKVYGLNRDTIKKIELVYPQSVEEQARIAEILMEWDKAIDLQEQYIDKLETRKKALMQKLLTPKEGWKEVRLSTILTERCSYITKDAGYKHVTLGKFGIVDKTEQYDRDFLVKDENKSYKITKYNDLCYNPANLKFGVISLNKYGDAIFSPIYITFEISKQCNADFIGAILCQENFIRYIRKYEKGTVYERQAVSPIDFLLGKIQIPAICEQNKIANILSQADEEISLQRQKLDKLILQRKAMQQYLLTGIVRV